jgi:ABC-2 type transport system ATP-binding protein
LTKHFGAVKALDGVDLEVRPSEIVSVLGQNGAGKSTLLRVLGTTVLPDAGRATVAGHDVVKEARAARRATGVVLGDERSWYWRLSGRANLEFFAALHGLGRKAASARAVELLALLGLEEVADRRFDRYSSGMKARLSVARALLARPPVLLLDEPSRTLDPVAAADLRRIMLDLTHTEDRAVLWVTHDLHEAAEVADRVIVVAHGRVAAAREQPSSAEELDGLVSSIVRGPSNGPVPPHERS